MRLALGAVGCAALVFSAGTVRAFSALEGLLSWRRLATEVDPALLARSEVAYDAGEEYQLCGALNFYLRRRLLLLEPPRFVPPTYLRQDVGRLFVPRERFWREWSAGRQRFLLFTSAVTSPDRPDGIPRAVYPVARIGERALLTNMPLSSGAGMRNPFLVPASRTSGP